MLRKLFIVLLISSPVVMFAQKDSTNVAAAAEKLRLAMISGNKTELENIALADLAYVHSGGKIESKEEFVNTIVIGKSDFVTIDITDQRIKMHGNTAIVTHMLQAKTNDNNKPAEVKLRIMLVFEKNKGEWKLLARQASKVVEH